MWGRKKTEKRDKYEVANLEEERVRELRRLKREKNLGGRLGFKFG